MLKLLAFFIRLSYQTIAYLPIYPIISDLKTMPYMGLLFNKSLLKE